MRPLAVALLAGALSAASLPVHETGFTAGPNGLPEGWVVWSPRAEIAPRTFLDPQRYRTRPSALAISGGWERAVPGVEATNFRSPETTLCGLGFQLRQR